LGEAIKDIRPSNRLTDSAVCLVADEGDMDLHLERMLKQHGHMKGETSRRILEINPTHDVIKRLIGLVDDAARQDDIADMAFLLLDQARIVEGEPIADPAAFSRRFNGLMAKGLGGTTNGS
jgi:molecular chaperone HtpG